MNKEIEIKDFYGLKQYLINDEPTTRTTFICYCLVNDIEIDFDELKEVSIVTNN